MIWGYPYFRKPPYLSIAIPAAQSHATLLRLSDPPRRILRELRQGGADLGPALRGALHLPRPATTRVRTRGTRRRGGDETRRLQGKNGWKSWKTREKRWIWGIQNPDGYWKVVIFKRDKWMNMIKKNMWEHVFWTWFFVVFVGPCFRLPKFRWCDSS